MTSYDEAAVEKIARAAAEAAVKAYAERGEERPDDADGENGEPAPPSDDQAFAAQLRASASRWTSTPIEPGHPAGGGRAA